MNNTAVSPLDFTNTISNILLACSGNECQYAETIEALEKIFEEYVSSVTETASKVACKPGVITTDDIRKATNK